MGFRDFFKGLFAEPPKKISFRGLPDEEIERLWSEREELTEEARGALTREVKRRGLELTDAPTGPTDAELDAEIADAMAQEEAELEALASGGMVIGFGADGSTTITTGGSRLVLNEPRSDDDGRPRSTDGLAVARRLLDTLSGRPVQALAYPFVDAALVVARAGEALPSFSDPGRARIAALCAAAATGDSAKALALGEPETARAERNAVLCRTDPVALLERAPAELGAIHRAAELEPELADRHLAAMADAELSDTLLVEATLLAMDRGLDPAPFHARWSDPDAIDDDERAHFWRAAEVRRLARIDLGEALDAELALPAEWKHDENASMAVAARLARVDPRRAYEHAQGLGPDLDHVGWLRGCVRGGAAELDALLDEWIAHLGPMTYDPHFYAKAVLEACIELGDVERARRCLEAGGPTGWQVAHAGRWALARADAPERFLEVLLDRHEPGAVAGRAVERHGFPLAAGKVVIRPPWLDFSEPHPVETLSVVAALGAEGPIWEWDWLP